MVRILIADDEMIEREVLCKTLRKNLRDRCIIFQAENGREALKVYEEHKIQIAILDIEMPEMNGIEATEAALRLKPGLKIIVLSMYGDEQYYYKMVDAGVKGFVLKSSGIEKVITAIHTVAEGENYFSEELLMNILSNMRAGNKTEPEVPDNEISEREMEILYHVCLGLSNQEIADKLFISKRTVDKHRANLLSKTGCKNTAALVMYAIRNKMISV